MNRKRILLLLVLLILAAAFFFFFARSAREAQAPALPPPAETALSELPSGEQTTVCVGRSGYLADFPRPYGAMLAICSDIDGSTLESFQRYHSYLNQSFWNDAVGDYGLGLDVADSFWIYGGETENAFSVFQGYDTEDPAGLNDICWYWKQGYIDSLHSFGDFSGGVSPERDYAALGWSLLREAGMEIPVFINHGSDSNRLNFGGYTERGLMRYQAGDDPDSPYYHTDLTLAAGVRYVWASEGSSRFGMDTPLYLIELRDGQKVWGFERYTHEEKLGKNDWVWTPSRLWEELSEAHLAEIVDKGQFAIVAQHLGSDDILSYEKNIYALKRLKAYQDEGKILVARTSRLLNYALARDYLRYAVTIEDGSALVEILELADPATGSRVPALDEIRGICFLLPGCTDCEVRLNGAPLEALSHGVGADGVPYWQIPWFGEEESHAEDQ